MTNFSNLPLWQRIVFGTLAVFLVFTAGVSAGRLWDVSESGSISSGVTDRLRLFRASEGLDFGQFWDVWDLTQELYYREISDEKLFEGAVRGIVEALEDPYSVYFSSDEAQEFNDELDGTFSGIGAEIGKDNEYITVIAPLAGSPAEQAGLRAGDYILSVDRQDIIDWSVDEAVAKIRGEAGTTVVLTLARAGTDGLFDVSIVRGEIQVSSVTWEIRDDGIGVIKISMFNEDTTGLFREAAREILAVGVDQVIIDLRNNPGGLLTEAMNIAGFWVNGATVVQEKIGDEIKEFSVGGIAWLEEVQTVVLVDGGTASGSEILAGALQDYGLAVIVGSQTYGKGSVQEYYEFNDGSAVKITIAEWLTAKGRSINNVGITPDVPVEFTIEDYEAKLDPQMDEALRILAQTR